MLQRLKQNRNLATATSSALFSKTASSQRAFYSGKYMSFTTTASTAKSQSLISTAPSEEQKMDAELAFVKRTPGLRQVQKRTSIDGFFPRVISPEEIKTVEDLQRVPDHMLADIVRWLRETHHDTKLSQALLRRLYDKDGELVEQMYESILLNNRSYSDKKGSKSSSASGDSQWMMMPGASYNMMIQSAAKFNRHQLLDQLLFESTVFGIPLDTQTYIMALRHQPAQVRYLREQLSREVHESDLSHIESILEFGSSDIAGSNNQKLDQVPRQHDPTDLLTGFSSERISVSKYQTSSRLSSPRCDEGSIGRQEEEEEEEEAECAMMAYFFSEAPSDHTQAILRSDLEGCGPLMAASFTIDDVTDCEDDDEVEFFDPFGQMNDQVQAVLLKLAREERTEQLAKQHQQEREVKNVASSTVNSDEQFYGHYSF